jgi:cytochrome c biogenesis protein CcmG/thiol:disulfide interchange protein DsbE
VNRFAWPLAGFILIAIVLAVGLRHADQKEIIASPLIGKPAPDFDVPDLNDTTARVSSAALKSGHWQLLNVWGTWCVECRAEHATLLQIKAEGKVPIIGLDWKDEDASALAWLAQLGNPYAAVGADRDGRVAVDWGVYGAPESFLVNPEGKIVRKKIGAISIDEWRRDFLPLVAAK